MKKIYNSKIIQYSLEGNQIEIFNNAHEAIKISNYDSILNCCKGKYKTAGGYVWRFENDPFTLFSKRDKNIIIKCKICNSDESIRSMAMHLKWGHGIKTEEYVLKYGEFRPKNLKEEKRIDNSEIKCQECNIKVKSHQHLMYHITKIHPELSKHDYIIKYIYNNNVPTCKCGCGQPTTLLENGRNCDLDKDTYSRDYIKGHWDWEVFLTTGKQSKEELELLDFIKTIYNGEIQTSVRNIIPKAEIDIFIPNINIGIEYNGLYWHSEKGGRFKDYHQSKMEKAQNKNIHLIQIFSDEWLNNKEIVKNKLKSILSEKSDKVYARKCEIREILPKDKNEFLNKHHIQGEDRSQIKLGMFYNEILIGVMTFSQPRISLGGNPSIKDVYELSRYASSIYIVGGASKFISYFRKKYNPKQIYSYSDNRWTDPNDNMSLKIGFIKEKTSGPNYFYTKDYTIRLHRYNFNKFKLKEMGADISKTEFRIMEELGYTKIWDCGSTKYSLYL